MLLLLDVGNTQTVIGVYQAGADASNQLHGMAHTWRISTSADRTADELSLLLSQLAASVSIDLRRDITGIAVSAVVPRAVAALRELAERYLPDCPFVSVGPGVKSGMPIRYDNPKEVGADRIANSVAAIDLYGAPCIVIDYGTATTFDVVDSGGEYLGGIILPGIEISLDALYTRAAALRRVELVPPRSVIGRTTVESIQSGALHGQAALLEGICSRIQDEVGPCTVVATGGLGGYIAQQTKAVHHHEPWLTLHGLRLVYERNAPPSSTSAPE
jgi:type III pantothenate kinase